MARFIFICLIIIAFTFTGAIAQQPDTTKPSADKVRDITHLLLLMGNREQAQFLLESAIASYGQVMPEAKKAEWEKIKAQFSPDEFLDALVPVYHRHFTHQDIKDLIVLFESPAGKKFIEKMPEVSNESYEASEKWATSVGKRVTAKLKEAGILNTAEPQIEPKQEKK